jgi:hypothetical protein
MDAGRVPNKVYDMETPNSLKQVIFRLDRRARAAKAIDDGAHRDTGYELGAERRQQVRLDRLDRQAALQRVLKARFTSEAHDAQAKRIKYREDMDGINTRLQEIAKMARVDIGTIRAGNLEGPMGEEARHLVDLWNSYLREEHAMNNREAVYGDWAEALDDSKFAIERKRLAEEEGRDTEILAMRAAQRSLEEDRARRRLRARPVPDYRARVKADYRMRVKAVLAKGVARARERAVLQNYNWAYPRR